MASAPRALTAPTPGRDPEGSESEQNRLDVQAEPVPYPFLKRLTDRGVSAVLVLLLSPVLLLVLVAMGIDLLLAPADRGGWLYRERRVSRGREFDLLKFRTLRAGALAEIRRHGGYARTYEADVANLTWAGRRFLKPWYLDELPQLFNVLRGDMSLVGPRPWPLSMVRDQIEQGYDYRNLILAGWTGPAQVQKGASDPVSYAELDLGYVESCRTWGSRRLAQYDLAILWQTVRVLLRGEGLSY